MREGGVVLVALAIALAVPKASTMAADRSSYLLEIMKYKHHRVRDLASCLLTPSLPKPMPPQQTYDSLDDCGFCTELYDRFDAQPHCATPATILSPRGRTIGKFA